LSSQSSTEIGFQIKFVYASHPYSTSLAISTLFGAVISAAIYAGFYYAGAKESIQFFATTAAEFIGMGAAVGFVIGFILIAAKCKEQSRNDDKQVPSTTAKVLS
jgi:hypothetical protein